MDKCRIGRKRKGGGDTSKGKEVETTSPRNWVQVEGRGGRGDM